MTQIRLANPVDAADLARLRYALRSHAKTTSETEAEFLRRCTDWMSSRLQAKNWRCWVVEQKKSIIGALWLQLVEKIPNPTLEPEFHAYITNFYITESARGQGLGSQVLNEALEFCRGQQIHGVILWPSEKSRSLYERHGFAVRPDLLELIIGSADPL